MRGGDRNSNIQPYKIIRRAAVRLSAMHAVREADRVRIEKIFFFTVLAFFLDSCSIVCLFWKVEAVLITWRVPASPCEPLSVLLSSAAATRDHSRLAQTGQGLDVRRVFLLWTRVIIDLNPRAGHLCAGAGRGRSKEQGWHRGLSFQEVELMYRRQKKKRRKLIVHAQKKKPSKKKKDYMFLNVPLVPETNAVRLRRERRNQDQLGEISERRRRDRQPPLLPLSPSVQRNKKA